MSKSKYYRVLGIQESASQEEVEQAYVDALDKYNPDKNPNSPFLVTMTQQVNEAYQAISTDRTVKPAVERPSNQPSETTIREIPSRGPINNNDKAAYSILFLLIGLLAVGTGYYFYSEYSKSSDAFIDQEEEVIVESNDASMDNAVAESENNRRDDGVEEGRTSNDAKAVEDVTISTKKEEVTVESKKVDSNVPVAKPTVKVADTPVKNKAVAEAPKPVAAPIQEKPVDKIEETISPKKFFKIGSTKDEVFAAQGEATKVYSHLDIDIWYYGDHRVRFKGGRVLDYVDPYKQLNVSK